MNDSIQNKDQIGRQSPISFVNTGKVLDDRWYQKTWNSHAICLISRDFETSGISLKLALQIAESQCGIKLNAEDSWEILSSHPDVFVADRDRVTLRLEDLNPIKELALCPPLRGKKRLFLIDRAERILAASGNSLLKLLEEPRSPVLFVLTLSRESEILNTILSRCQKIYLPSNETTGADAICKMYEEEIQNYKEILELLRKTKLNGDMSSKSTSIQLKKCLSQAINFFDGLAKKLKGRLLIDVTFLAYQQNITEDFALGRTTLLQFCSSWNHDLSLNPSGAQRMLSLYCKFLKMNN